MKAIATQLEPFWSALARFFFTDDAQEHFLARSVDHADLERRTRIYERGAPFKLFH